MEALKKQKKAGQAPDMMFINAAALQDHYLRSVNLNMKPPSSMPKKMNPIVKKLKLQEQRNEILQQMREESQKERLSAGGSKSNSSGNIPKSVSGISSSGNSNNNITSNTLESRTSNSRESKRDSINHIRVGFSKVILHPMPNFQPKKKPNQFLPPLPHEIDRINQKEEEQQDKIKMAKYLNKLTLAQRLGIVAVPPKPLTREDWGHIEEQSKKREEGQCPICLEDFKDREQIILSCSHVFHKVCLESYEKHNKVMTCPICRRTDYDKKLWNDGYKKYIVKCALMIQTLWRASTVRGVFFADLIARKYQATSVRLRRKIIGHKLGKYNAKMDTALKDRRKHTQKALKNYDENIKKLIDEMYANMNQIQTLKEHNAQDIVQFINKPSHGQIQEEFRSDFQQVIEEQRNVERRRNSNSSGNNNMQSQQKGNYQEIFKKNSILSETEWKIIHNKALERGDKDCSICFNNMFLSEHLNTAHVHSQSCSQKCSQSGIQNKDTTSVKNQQKGLYILSCTHVFHANCLSAFERYNLEENQVCPICRAKYTKQHFVIQAQQGQQLQ